MCSAVNKAITKWLSFVILKTCDIQVKNEYRKLERIKLKLEIVKSHLLFNETCVINKLLPVYTNIYIYMYMYIYLYMTVVVIIKSKYTFK